MNWIKRFLGFYDKEQNKRTEDVAAYVYGKKKEYAKDMASLQKQAKTVHNQTRQAHEGSAKLNIMVEDITRKIAKVTGASI